VEVHSRLVIRDRVSRVLPATLKRRVRPLAALILQGLERPRLERLYRPFVDPGDLVFDVGAAEGAHTVVFRRLGARVVAVEPQPYCLDVLRRRVGADDGVTVVAAGVADRPGELELHVSVGDPELSTFDPERGRVSRFAGRRWEGRVRVPVVTLEQLSAVHGQPAFVKVDVEGFEPRVCAGLVHPPRALCFELTGELLGDARECLERLSRPGPVRCNLTLERRHRLVYPRWLEPEELLARLGDLAPRRLQGDVFVRWR
jgi:FkbM family methyltransferase